jgi:hypothetical protein
MLVAVWQRGGRRRAKGVSGNAASASAALALWRRGGKSLIYGGVIGSGNIDEMSVTACGIFWRKRRGISASAAK